MIKLSNLLAIIYQKAKIKDNKNLITNQEKIIHLDGIKIINNQNELSNRFKMLENVHQVLELNPRKIINQRIYKNLILILPEIYKEHKIKIIQKIIA